jgi:hypothetical protein
MAEKHLALLTDGVVRNVIVVGPDGDDSEFRSFLQGAGHTVKEVTDRTGPAIIGGTLHGGKFIHPPTPEPTSQPEVEEPLAEEG